MFVLGIAVSIGRKPQNILKPDSVLPLAVRSLVPSAVAKAYVGPVPWLSAAFERTSLKCRRQGLCGTRAYSITLPRLAEPGRPDGWSPTNNTWHLSTLDQFATEWPVEYPVATIVRVPKDAPESAKFLTDAEAGPENREGLRPTINQDDSLLNFEHSGPTRGRNITGDYPHSFVLVNDADHVVYFASTSVGPRTRPEWYAIEPGQWVLCWPATRYWASIAANSERKWNCSVLPIEAQKEDVAVSLAETLMYDVLAPTAPLATSP